MTPVLGICAIWWLFAVSHIGSAAGPVRTRPMASFGERGVLGLFDLVAWIGLGLLLGCHACTGSRERRGWAWAN